jgi:hypothetical protein
MQTFSTSIVEFRDSVDFLEENVFDARMMQRMAATWTRMMRIMTQV